MSNRDVYLKSTDKDGRVTFSEHRCWDHIVFLASKQSEAMKEGGKAKVEQLTREQYREQRGAK